MTIRKAKMPTRREKNLKKKIMCVLSVFVSANTAGFVELLGPKASRQ